MTLQRLGIVIDPICSINPKKDSSFAMMLAAQAQGTQIFIMEMHDIYIEKGIVGAKMQRLAVEDNAQDYFMVLETLQQPLHHLDVILMRKDPPVDRMYLYTTHLLSLAEQQDVRVINSPAALRDFNEKLFALWFPECVPPTLVSANQHQLQDFIHQHPDTILKPLYGMGGISIFKVRRGDANITEVIDTLTAHGQELCMAQKFIPEITEGDKRILLIDGEPIPYALARIPHPNDFRGNLSQGASAVAKLLTARDKWICEHIRPMLKAKGLMFVGIDVIGDYLTEINITSPTGIRELDKLCDLNIADDLMRSIEKCL